MTNFVRVQDTVTGHHITISASLAKRHGKRYVELKQDAVDRDGHPLPPKYKTTPADPAESEATTATITTEANEEATE